MRCAVLGSDSSSFFRHLDVVVLNEFFGLSLLFALTRSEQQRAEFSSTVYVVGQNFVSDVS